MPYRSSSYRRRNRRNYGRKRTFKRRSYGRRRTNFKRRRIGDSTVYRYARYYQLEISAPQDQANIATGAITYNLSKIPGYAEFTQLYEEYKITKIKYKFMPRLGQNYEVNRDWGNFSIWNDFDDATPPGISDLNEKGTAKTININAPNTPFTWTCRPKYQVPVYRTGVTFGYMPKRGAWISTQNSDVTHYGTKWLWQNLRYTTNPTTTPPRIIAQVKVYAKFRRPT